MPRQKSLLRVIAEPILIACVLAIAVRAFARIYSVPSASMEPALRPGDHIVVTRFLTDTPARGDVIVFRHPAGADLTVKRVIAIAGDLIDTVDGRVRIAGQPLAEPYAPGSAGSIPAQLVPAGHLFVMGDNRGDSWDSRHWGPLPARLIVGRARLVLWSAGDSRSTSLSISGSRRIFKWIE